MLHQHWGGARAGGREQGRWRGDVGGGASSDWWWQQQGVSRKHKNTMQSLEAPSTAMQLDPPSNTPACLCPVCPLPLPLPLLLSPPPSPAPPPLLLLHKLPCPSPSCTTTSPPPPHSPLPSPGSPSCSSSCCAPPSFLSPSSSSGSSSGFHPGTAGVTTLTGRCSLWVLQAGTKGVCEWVCVSARVLACLQGKWVDLAAKTIKCIQRDGRSDPPHP